MADPPPPSEVQPVDPPALPNDGIDDLLFGLDADDLNDFDGLDDFGDGLIPEAVQQPLGGFTTGRMKNLPPPSSASLARVRKLFEDDAIATEDGPSSTVSPGSSKRPKFNDSSSSFSGIHPVPPLPSISMFKTASDKSIPPPSATVLNRISAIFDEFPSSQTGMDGASASRTVPAFTSPFKTASGAQGPSLSAEAKSKAMSLFDEAPFLASESIGSAMPSFTTAAGKATPAVSAASLARAKAILNDNDDDTFFPVNVAGGPALGLTSATSHVSKSSAFVSPMLRTGNLSSEGSAPAHHQWPKEIQPTASASFATPSRTPLRTTTNTFANRVEVTPTPAKPVQPIQIHTPSAPVRRIGMGGTPVVAGRPKRPYVTPFKAPSCVTAQPSHTPATRVPIAGAVPRLLVKETVTQIYPPIFDLDPGPSRRRTMREAFLKPQYYSHAELTEMSIPSAILQMTLDKAAIYHFVEPERGTSSASQAVPILKRDGCHLVTAKWVQNHWAHIVWKLAGQIQARPELLTDKWTSTEILNQLRYRYEREYNRAQRPVVRRIHEHDSPAGLPIILVVTAIHYAAGDQDEADRASASRASLELSDGWYRIRAELDQCLTRAARKGRIAVGRKLAIMGAKLESSGEGSEALEGLDKSRLLLSGNGTSLARWDATLGLQDTPFIAGLSSLSVDGGVIPLVDVVIEKLFPLAFMYADKSNREPPWNEEEEARRADEWSSRREGEATRLQDEIRKRIEPYEDLVATLAAAAEEAEGPYDDSPPDDIESSVDTLLRAHNPSLALRSVPSGHIPHLAREAQLRLGQEMQDAQVEMTSQLNDLVPARQIRDFRMARVVDAREGRKERARAGMVNVWEAKALDGVLQEGGRYLITNIMPGRNGDWSVPRPGRAEIYLHTRRDTRWRLVE